MKKELSLSDLRDMYILGRDLEIIDRNLKNQRFRGPISFFSPRKDGIELGHRWVATQYSSGGKWMQFPNLPGSNGFIRREDIFLDLKTGQIIQVSESCSICIYPRKECLVYPRNP